MSISTLANTKWVFNNTFPSDFTYNQWNINFKSNNTNYNILEIDNVEDIDGPYTNKIYYLDNNLTGDVVFSDYNNGWGVNGGTGAFRFIEITGGTDVTNANLIAWLEANATQVEVTSLANTKWVFNNEINVSSFQWYTYLQLNFESNNVSYTHFLFGEDSNNDGQDALYYQHNTSYRSGDMVYVLDVWQNNAYKTISITNGTDIANPDLIVWLTENATLQPNVPVKTFDLSKLHLLVGTYEIKVKARASGFKDSNFSNAVTYVVTGGGTVSFTITQQRTYAKDYVRIYDGRDATGTLLYESTSTSSETLTPTVICTSGYLYLEAGGSIIWINVDSVSGGVSEDAGTIYGDSVIFKVDGNGTATCDVDYED